MMVQTQLSINLSNKKAFVCGASMGIGRAIAMTLAQAGAELTLLARDEKKLNSVLCELPGSGHQILVADLDHLDETEKNISRHIQKNGSHEILILNTGGPKSGPLTEAKENEFSSALSRHLLANVMLTRNFLPGMKEKKYGRIINILSTSVKIPIPNLGVSNTVRAAIANWSKTLAGEVAPFGITVNNILPGFTNTERLDELMEETAVRQKTSFENITEQWKKTIPMGRFANSLEIANGVAFLCSPLASYITGINLPIDGGRTGCL